VLHILQGYLPGRGTWQGGPEDHSRVMAGPSVKEVWESKEEEAI
jgi:hypothetical protein